MDRINDREDGSMGGAGRGLRALALLAALGAMLAGGRAEAAWSDVLRDGLGAARAAEQTLRWQAERAIIAGGVLLYRHRHAVAGAALGCMAGSAAATTAAVGAGLATGGAAFAGTAPALALGCGLGAVAGAAVGHPLDEVYDAR
jgi:hypothetical protein